MPLASDQGLPGYTRFDMSGMIGCQARLLHNGIAGLVWIPGAKICG